MSWESTDMIIKPLVYTMVQQKKLMDQLASSMGIPLSFVTGGDQDPRMYQHQIMDDHFVKTVQDVQDKTFIDYLRGALEALSGASQVPRDNVEGNCR